MIRIDIILKFVVCLCLSLIISTTIGQDSDQIMEKTGTLRGNIVDLSSRQNPIEGVRVEIENIKGEIFTVYTDKAGNYKKTGLAEGRYSISTHKEGYSSIGRSKVVATGGEGYDQIGMRKKITIFSFFYRGLFIKAVFTWQLFVGFALGFLAALLLNSLHTRSEVR